MNNSTFVDYHKLVLCLQCEHNKNSHKWNMCYGDFASCLCEKFQSKVDDMEYERISEILASNTWKETE